MKREIDLSNYLLPGRLRKKDGFYHLVIDTTHPITKKPIRHSESTKLKVIGETKRKSLENENEAVYRLMIFREKWSKYYFSDSQNEAPSILFTDYMKQWLYSIKPNIEPYTFRNYKFIVERRVIPYFEEKGTTLKTLKAYDIQQFYSYCMNERNLNPNTVIRYHANIRKALQTALKQELVTTNQADLVDRPKKRPTVINVLSPSDIRNIFNYISKTHLALPMFLAMFYGLRRSEALGVLWSNIDFENNLLKISNTLVEGENREIINKKRLKNKSSHRILPLIPEVVEFLKNLKLQQEENKKYFKNSYNKNFLDNVCVKENGDIIKPAYVTQKFTDITRKLGYKDIHFHCLRHSFATNMYMGGVDMNTLKELLGHSCITTTIDTYTHLPNIKVMEAGKNILEVMKIKNEERKIIF